MNLAILQVKILHNLHSTMVLFKLTKMVIALSYHEFTFHYGPIQIIIKPYISLDLKYLHSTMVLFKYRQVARHQTGEEIYIPLWSYSNMKMYSA